MRHETFYNRAFFKRTRPIEFITSFKFGCYDGRPQSAVSRNVRCPAGLREVEMTEAFIEAAVSGILTVNRALLFTCYSFS
jgi:hypothetical protein